MELKHFNEQLDRLERAISAIPHTRPKRVARPRAPIVPQVEPPRFTRVAEFIDKTPKVIGWKYP